jgi:membrane-associated protease RseP (regulator of RpoE activity)
VTVDSGSGGPLTLFRPFVAAHNFEAKYRPHVAIIAGKNIGGDVRARITRARHVQIGDFEVVEPITEFLLQSGRQPINDALAGSIGNAVLKRFTVTFDYARHVIFFAPNGDFAKRDIFDRAGIIVHRRADNRSFVVGEVIRQSSAYGAGIRANDRILKVDGVPAPGVDLDGMQAKMKQPVGTPLRLEVERDGRSRNVTLVLQEIL